MPISEVLWPEERVEHIAQHGVRPEEFEEVCFGSPRLACEGYVLGETDAGRALFCVVIELPGGRGYPVTARDMTIKEREAALRRLEETMMPKIPTIPTTDSIQELATFWQRHDVTDFEDDLEEVHQPVLQRAHVVGVRLSGDERQAVREAAASRGLDEAALIHEWVREKLRHA